MAPRMTSLPRCSATRSIGVEGCAVSRMIGQVHIATRSFGSSRTTDAQIATAIASCTAVEVVVREVISLTVTVTPIPSRVPRMRPAKDERVSCKRSYETITADIAAQSPCSSKENTTS